MSPLLTSCSIFTISQHSRFDLINVIQSIYCQEHQQLLNSAIINIKITEKQSISSLCINEVKNYETFLNCLQQSQFLSLFMEDVLWFCFIIQNMSFVQEFVEQQLSKSLSSTIKQQLQVCHSAVEDLLVNLESLRSGPKHQIISLKIRRISVFLEAKQQILKLIQSEEDQPLIQWLIEEKLDSPLLMELVRQEQKFVMQMLRKTIKTIFLSGEKLEGYLQENELVSSCLSHLVGISEDLAIGKTPSRERLINVDNVQDLIWDKITIFQNKVVHFNREIAKIIDQLYDFQNSLSEQFRLFFSKNTHFKTSPMKSRLEALENPDQIYEENIMLDPANETSDNKYSRTVIGSKFGGNYRQEPLYRTGFPNRDNCVGKMKIKNEVSQLGINSHIIINPSVNRDRQRGIRSQLLAETKPFLR